MSGMRTSRGFTLVEVLVYMILLTFLISLAGTAFHQILSHSRRITRNTDDISAAVRVGERWRSDVRDADARIRARGQGQFLPRSRSCAPLR